MWPKKTYALVFTILQLFIMFLFWPVYILHQFILIFSAISISHFTSLELFLLNLFQCRQTISQIHKRASPASLFMPLPNVFNLIMEYFSLSLLYKRSFFLTCSSRVTEISLRLCPGWLKWFPVALSFFLCYVAFMIWKLIFHYSTQSRIVRITTCSCLTVSQTGIGTHIFLSNWFHGLQRENTGFFTVHFPRVSTSGRHTDARLPQNFP